MIQSRTTTRFWALFDRLPPDIRVRADKQYQLFLSNPAPPSLHLKQVGEFWAARVTDDFRALAIREGETFTWVWIGSHQEYDRIINRK